MSTLSPALATESTETEVVIDGGGWGHAIGMSQYGAYGQALDGQSAEDITGYYYTGSSTAQIVDQVGSGSWLVTDPSPLWVNLVNAKSAVGFTAVNGSLTVCHTGSGGCAFTAKPGQVWQFVTLGNGTCRFVADGKAVSSAGQCKASVKGMTPGGAHVEVAGLEPNRDEFARGILRIRTPNSGTSLHASLEIALEEYLYGLAEMPFYWHSEALQAQALAGRSYATWRMISRGPEPDFSDSRKTQCWCHMYATTADQSYSGWANEAVATAVNWKAAVDATAGTVITHPEASQANVVAAFYSSSTGGRTENKEDLWGGTPVGYLSSRPDPWSQDPAVSNPFGSWSYPFTEAQLAAAYSVDKIDGLEVVARYASGTPSQVNIYARSGGEDTTIVTSGPAMFSELGLRGRNISGFNYGHVPAVAGDFTGDGRSDVSLLLGFNQTWWTGAASGGRFAMSPWFNQGSTKALTGQVTGDFDGDGMDDIAALQEVSGRLRVAFSTGQRFRVETWAKHTDRSRWGPLLVGDFDGNGNDDIAEYDNRRERWRVYRWMEGGPTKEWWYDFDVADPNWGAFAVGDYNGDGLDDLLATDAGTGKLTVLFSDGTRFEPSTWQTLPSAGAGQVIRAADFTGDAVDDLAAFDPATATWWVVAGRNSDTATGPVAWHTFGLVGQDFGAQIVGDYNDDGMADIAAYSRANGKLKVLLSRGDGFNKSVWGTIRARKRITTLLSVDVNGDGATDIAAWDNTRRRWWVAEAGDTQFEVTRWGKLLR
jgi:SpoIID/LytB domain protein